MHINNDIRALYRYSRNEGRTTGKVLVRAAKALGIDCELVTWAQEFTSTGNPGRSTIQIRWGDRVYQHNSPNPYHEFSDFASDVVDTLSEAQLKELQIDYHLAALKQLGVVCNVAEKNNSGTSYKGWKLRCALGKDMPSCRGKARTYYGYVATHVETGYVEYFYPTVGGGDVPLRLVEAALDVKNKLYEKTGNF